MDPLYANYDKRKKALEENSAPVPQPTPNLMPVFGAAAAPTAPVSTSTPEPVVELTIEHTPDPAPVPEPIVSPEPVSEPIAAPMPEPAPEPIATQPQNPFGPQPVPFEQQFEQMVDGAAPAQLSQPQPQFNPNYTGTGDIVLNLDQPKKKLNTKLIAIIAGAFVVILLVVVLLLTSGKKGGASGNSKQAINDFIEYFVYGTEGKNEVDAETLNGDPEEFAFTQSIRVAGDSRNTTYEEKIYEKIENINAKNVKDEVNMYIEMSKYLQGIDDYMLTKHKDNTLDDEMEEIFGNSIKKYKNQLALYFEIIEDNDCVVRGKVDTECKGDISDEEFDKVIEEKEKTRKELVVKENKLFNNIIIDLKGII